MTETAILKTAAHELTHFIQANSAQYEALKSFVVNKLTHEEGVSFEDLVADKQRREPGLEYDEAVDEVVADACEMMLGDSTVVEQLAKENRSLAEKIRDWLREWVENLKIALEGLQADRTESRAMMQYARELQEIWDNALVDAARNNRGTVEKAAPAESRQQARVGTDEESGKPIYQANFPKGTPKAAKAQRILSLIQNVWSKKPISLVVRDADGRARTIEARFDPTYDASNGKRSDASKLMGGNRHGSGSEQRVTLDLADDYYEIAAESTYNYSKSETGKSSATHEGGQLLEGYLDIKKPLSDSEVTLTAAEVKRLIRAVDPTGDDLLQRKLLQLDEANAELEALKEERKVLLASRKVKELTRDEQFDLAQNRNRTETQKGKMFVNRIQRVARNNIS